jgi:hypothetical protein
VGALFTGVLAAAFFDALLATAVFFVAITTLYPIFFVGCDATSATGGGSSMRWCRSENMQELR